MINAIRAELRKLLTVRGTYYFVIAAMLIVLLYAGFISGYRITPPDLQNSSYLTEQIFGAIGAVGILGGLASLLLLANEYRHSTIIYTLTLSRSRTQVLAAKFLVISLFMTVFTLLAMVIAPLATLGGLQLHHYHLVHQAFDYPMLLWRSWFVSWGYGMFALIIAAIIRNQIGAIVVFLLTPTTAESLLSLLLKNNSKYLPFTALGQVGELHPPYSITASKSALVALVYIVIGWVVAWALFLRRDAN